MIILLHFGFEDYLLCTSTVVEPILFCSQQPVQPFTYKQANPVASLSPIHSFMILLVSSFVLPPHPTVTTISKPLNSPKAKPHLDRCMCMSTARLSIEHPIKTLNNISQHRIRQNDSEFPRDATTISPVNKLQSQWSLRKFHWSHRGTTLIRRLMVCIVRSNQKVRHRGRRTPEGRKWLEVWFRFSASLRFAKANCTSGCVVLLKELLVPLGYSNSGIRT